MYRYILALLVATAMAQAPNAVCEDALPLEVGVRTAFSLNGVPGSPLAANALQNPEDNNSEYPDPFPNPSGESVLWYTFTLPETGYYTLSTCDVNFAAAISLVRGAPSDTCTDFETDASDSNMDYVEFRDFRDEENVEGVFNNDLIWARFQHTGYDDGSYEEPGNTFCGHYGYGQTFLIEGTVGEQFTMWIGNWFAFGRELSRESDGTVSGGSGLGNGAGWGSVLLESWPRPDGPANRNCYFPERLSFPAEVELNFAYGGFSNSDTNGDYDDRSLSYYFLLDTSSQSGDAEISLVGGHDFFFTLYDAGEIGDDFANVCDTLDSGIFTIDTDDYGVNFQAPILYNSGGAHGESYWTGDEVNFDFDPTRQYILKVSWQYNPSDIADGENTESDDGFQYYNGGVPEIMGTLKLSHLYGSATPEVPTNSACLDAIQLTPGVRTPFNAGHMVDVDYSGESVEAIYFYFEPSEDTEYGVDVSDVNFPVDVQVDCGLNNAHLATERTLADYCDFTSFGDDEDDSSDAGTGYNDDGFGQIIYIDVPVDTVGSNTDDYDYCIIRISSETTNTPTLAEAFGSILVQPQGQRGDSCFRPQEVALGAPARYSLFMATPDGPHICSDIDEANVWFRFQAPFDGVYSFSTLDQDFIYPGNEQTVAIELYPEGDSVCNGFYNDPIPCSEEQSLDVGDYFQDFGIGGVVTSPVETDDILEFEGGTVVTVPLLEKQTILIAVYSQDSSTNWHNVGGGYLHVTASSTVGGVSCEAPGGDPTAFCGAGIPAGCGNDSGVAGSCTCFCDSQCVNFGDCCFDYCETCAGTSDEHLEACGLAIGDPHIRGYYGDQFEVKGKANQVYNLLTDHNVHLNAKFVESCAASSKRTANIMSEVGLMYGDSKLHWIAESGEATLNGQRLQTGVKLPLESSTDELAHVELEADTGRLHFVSEDYVITLSPRMNRCGQRVSDVAVEFRNRRAMPHGLLGQTETPAKARSNVGRVPGKGFSMHQGEGYIEGEVQDYQVHGKDLFGVDFRFNRFGQERQLRSAEEAPRSTRVAPGLEKLAMRAQIRKELAALKA